MTDNEVLNAIKALTNKCSDLRTRSARPVESQRACIDAIPAPSVPIRIFDNEIAAFLQADLEQVNCACVRLIESGKIKLINTDHVRVKQDGHLYELTADAHDSDDMILVKRIIRGFQVKHVLDRDIVVALEKMHLYKTVQWVNGICSGLLHQGWLKVDGDIGWINPENDGYTYEVVGE